MGSSVFHGGFSTFLSIVALAPSKTYIFVVFFKMWFGIILFGLGNGFLLLPVILSYIGPVDTMIDEEHLESNEKTNPDLDKELFCCWYRKKKNSNKAVPIADSERGIELQKKNIL